MVVGNGGIGNIRDIGDPYDPRRGNPSPQPIKISGIPSPTEGFDFGTWAQRQQGQVTDPATIEKLRYVRNQQIDEQLRSRYPDRYTASERAGRQLVQGRNDAGLDAAGFRQADPENPVQTSPWNKAAVSQESQRVQQNLQFAEAPVEVQRQIVSQLAGTELDVTTTELIAGLVSPGERGTDFGLDLQSAIGIATGDIEAKQARAFGKSGEVERDTTKRTRRETADRRPIFSEAALTEEQQLNLDSQDAAKASDKLLYELEQAEQVLAQEQLGSTKRTNQKRNKLNSEVNDRKSPFTVPVLMGPQVRNSTGPSSSPKYVLGAERINLGFKDGKPQNVIDPTNASTAAINPAALLPSNYASARGLTKRVTRQSVDSAYKPGGYDPTLYVPSGDEQAVQNEYIYRDEYGQQVKEGEKYATVEERKYSGQSLPYDDPGISGEYENVPMTVGQAVDELRTRNKTPLVHLTDENILSEAVTDKGGNVYTRYFAKKEDGSRGPEVFYNDNIQKPEDKNAYPRVTTYRVGTGDPYRDSLDTDVMDLFRAISGGKIITDGIQNADQVNPVDRQRLVGGETLLAGDKAAFWDPEVRNLQRSMLEQSIAEGDLPNQKTVFRDIVSLLASGKALPPDDQAAPFVRVDQPVNRGGQQATVNTRTMPSGLLDERSELAAEIRQQTDALAASRKTEADQFWSKSRTKPRKTLEERIKPYSDNPGAIKELERRDIAAKEAYRQASLEAAQSPTVIAQNEVAFEAYENKVQAETERAYAVSEQNTHSPQSVDTGVMNTDDVSMLNAPEPPVIRDEPTPRQQQIAASAPARTTNAAATNPGMNFLREFMGRARRNPVRTAAAAAGTGLGVLGALPYDPREGE